jgi:hypothetical protein
MPCPASLVAQVKLQRRVHLPLPIDCCSDQSHAKAIVDSWVIQAVSTNYAHVDTGSNQAQEELRMTLLEAGQLS